MCILISLLQMVPPVLLPQDAEEADVLGLRCVQEAGDLLYVPSNWGHTTLNLRASVGFAQECNADACS